MAVIQNPTIRSRASIFFRGLKELPSNFIHFGSQLVLYCWAGFTIFSFIWIIVASFKTNRELFSQVWQLPSSLQFDNYIKAWSVVHMGTYFLNSVVIVSMAVLFILIFAAPAAYILSRFKFRGNEAITNLFIAGMGIPYQVLLVPLFMLLRQFSLIDNRFGLVLVYVGLSLPFSIFLLTGFFRTLPMELEEAAAIDGCSEFDIFRKVMLPLASPGLVSAAIFNFISLWNEYLLALVMITTEEKRTLSLGLYALQGAMQYTSDWVGLFAGVVIILLPTLLIYIIMSERVLEGITLGAVK